MLQVHEKGLVPLWLAIFLAVSGLVANGILYAVKTYPRPLPPLVISHSPLPPTTPETTPTNNLTPEEPRVAQRDIGGCKSFISEVTQNLINRDYGNSGYKGFFTQAGEDGRNVAIVPLLYADKGYCLQYPHAWEIELEGLNESGLFFNRSIVKNGALTDVFPPTTTGTIQALQVQVTGRDNLSLEDADKATMSYELSGPHPLVKADEKVISKNITTIGTKEVLRLALNCVMLFTRDISLSITNLSITSKQLRGRHMSAARTTRNFYRRWNKWSLV